MTKYTFVGDIHGKVDVVEHALDKEGQIIFVGDFVDSYEKTKADEIRCVELVLDAIEKGKARAIFGNHELSYLQPTQHRCSGYNITMDGLILPLKTKMFKLLEPFIRIDTWLITHAGMHSLVEEQFNRDGRSMEEWVDDVTSAAHQIGRYRGGWSKVGGIYWCDFNAEFEPIDGLNQIFGHTRGVGIRTNNTPNSTNYCIDCLDYNMEFLELEI